MQRRLQLVAQARVQRQRRCDAPVVLDERVVRRLPHVHRRRAGLALRQRRHAEQEARERVAGAVRERRAAGDRRRELEVAAVLEEPEHVPDESSRVPAEADGMLRRRSR